MMRTSAISRGRLQLVAGVYTVLLLGLPLAAQAQSAARGKTLFESRCTVCHRLDENLVGPALQTVVGRKAGTAKDYDYSPALASATHRWNRQMLLAWLTEPETVAPGQRMGFRVEKAADREDIVAFLTAQGKARAGSK